MPVLLFCGLIGVAVIQFIAGWQGIEYHLGFWAAIAAVAVALVFRFTLPLTVGTFFGALSVWGWHWAPALLLTLPGLALVVPSVVAEVIATATGRK
jgi:hypothetical protein